MPNVSGGLKALQRYLFNSGLFKPQNTPEIASKLSAREMELLLEDRATLNALLSQRLPVEDLRLYRGVDTTKLPSVGQIIGGEGGPASFSTDAGIARMHAGPPPSGPIISTRVDDRVRGIVVPKDLNPYEKEVILHPGTLLEGYNLRKLKNGQTVIDALPTQDSLSPHVTMWKDGGSVVASPRNKAIGTISDALRSARDFGDRAELPVLGGLGSLLLGQSPEELNEWSYGNAPMQMTPQGVRLPQMKRGRGAQVADTAFAAADLPALRTMTAAAGRPLARAMERGIEATPPLRALREMHEARSMVPMARMDDLDDLDDLDDAIGRGMLREHYGTYLRPSPDAVIDRLINEARLPEGSSPEQLAALRSFVMNQAPFKPHVTKQRAAIEHAVASNALSPKQAENITGTREALNDLLRNPLPKLEVPLYRGTMGSAARPMQIIGGEGPASFSLSPGVAEKFAGPRGGHRGLVLESFSERPLQGLILPYGAEDEVLLHPSTRVLLENRTPSKGADFDVGGGTFYYNGDPYDVSGWAQGGPVKQSPLQRCACQH